MKTNLETLAASRGGECLGLIQQEGRHKKYLWKCSKGHIWEARTDSVTRGTWCPFCNRDNQKNTLDEMQNLARQKGGEFQLPVMVLYNYCTLNLFLFK